MIKLLLSSLLLISGYCCFSQTRVSEIDKLKYPTLLWTADRSIDDQLIAVGGDDSLLRIYSAKTLEVIGAYRMSGMIRQVSWSPKNNLLAVATSTDQIGVLNIDDGSFLKLGDIKYGARAIGWNYTGELLATADGAGLVKIWNTKGKLLRTIGKTDHKSYFALHWHPKENILAVSGDEIGIMDTAGLTRKIIKHRKENTGILTVRWHPSGEFFASGDYGHHDEGVESIIQFWKKDGSLVKTMSAGKAEFRNIRWSGNGKFLASASDALRIWDEGGKLLHTGESEDLLWGITWNSKGDSIVTTSINGRIALWNRKAKLIRLLN